MSVTEAPPAEQTAETAKKKSEPRPYVVLHKVPQDSPSQAQVWEFVRTVTAISPKQAIEEAAGVVIAASEADTHSFVAVPARNFRPITVGLEVETKLKFS